jgi:hypothetical protein
MSVNPLLIYAATCASDDDALADHDSLLELHQAELAGTYDGASRSARSSGSCFHRRSSGRRPSPDSPEA